MQAFYLKYRPQTLDDLVGQESVKKILKSAYEVNKLSHAYLLVGPRGTGKTSTARILAKMVNCLEEKNVPCNKCNSCLSITDGSSLDLIEIDAASNRGIEDIRSLREKIKLAPSSSKKKVYIIDEVHMLTQEAFNALLKTLEEPPAHALFILATTEVSKLPQTILSRVQRLDFKLATSGELTEALEKIIKLEKIDIEKEALESLVKKADGSFRDGVKLLDQVASLGGQITKDLLSKNLKDSDFEEIIAVIKNLSLKKSAESLITLQQILEGGLDVKQLSLEIMSMLRNLVLIKNGTGEKLVKGDFTTDKYEQLLKLSDNFSNKDLIKILDSLQKCLERLKFSSIPQLPLELAIVEICESQLSVLSGQLSDKGQPVVSQSVEESENEKLEFRSEKADEEVRGKIQNITLQDPTSHIQPPTSISDSADIQKLKEKWTFVLETIRPYNFSLEALLRSTNIAECSETTVIMEVPYSFHQRILEAPKNRDLLEGILSEVLGRSIKVSTVLGTRPQRKEDIANIEVAADDEIIRIASEIFNSEPN